MEAASVSILGVSGALFLLGFGAFAIQSLREGERRAACVSLGLAVAGPLLLGPMLLLPGPWRAAAALAVAAVSAAAALAILIPWERRRGPRQVPAGRVDERDTMFARYRLTPGSEAYGSYYAENPGNRVPDDQIRSLPGLLSRAALKADPLLFASADASFRVCEVLRDHVDGAPRGEPLELEPAAAAAYLKGLARHLGAADAGVTELRPYHLYTHVGRGSGRWGDPVELGHRWALAYTLEMDAGMVAAAPEAPEVVEAAGKYAVGAMIGVHLAALIRSLGYPARAHIDGNYRVIAPLVARDAGLGEIGRIGLLMSPRLGPRVRLGVVTTDLPLVPDSCAEDPSVVEFCRICRKCAAACPSRSLPFDDRRESGGALRWRLDPVTCYRYWNTIGTDCGRCLAVCPYSHPDNAFHNVIRWAVRRSALARRLALWMDDLFYGRVPATRSPPRWLEPPQSAKNPF